MRAGTDTAKRLELILGMSMDDLLLPRMLASSSHASPHKFKSDRALAPRDRLRGCTAVALPGQILPETVRMCKALRTKLLMC